ncbi:DUF2071 domain-containing protein [Hymenobacter jeollabukensis]|uniref:DUF2071 domain-containing protein n=1 Tax=Hymenobacter jeollabukensis TaxID=2025313 RepID=A0A5R8WX11_9BACT|nr:DUF2071 domain-containing protein [Hymenobacter jeollabukensis]TLM97006.1 hypothetical protein FDY95_03170 [Hymenobacter jeollabukensis]
MLHHHPFAVEALLARTTVLTYAAPAAALQPLLPPCLTLNALDGRGFVAVALVQTRQLRPRGLPAWLGQDFFLIGYRLLVRYTSAAGKRLRGLYILRSETDRRRMTLLGNMFTSYGYVTVDIQQHAAGSRQRIHSTQSGLDIVVDHAEAAPALPPGSPFADWAQARRYAGPLPFTFSYHAPERQVVIVQGRREEWAPQPVRVVAAEVPFLAQLTTEPLTLASAFVTENIPYHWQKGRIEQWKG